MSSIYGDYENGDRDIFFRELMSNFLHGHHDETKEKLRRVMGGENFVAKYCEEFEVLLRDVDRCDPDKSIRSIIEYSAMGDLYWILSKAYDRKMRYSERER